MKDFELRVKNLSTHRFPLGTDPAKECFILNVAAHKYLPLCPVLEGSRLKAVFHMTKKTRSINSFTFLSQ
ncbi:MAG: hypothetical protein IJE83_04760, partial [Oscillospiraceae bacterium]|nr:hypothetical protein [Oscillospiraceae bacterium]